MTRQDDIPTQLQYMSIDADVLVSPSEALIVLFYRVLPRLASPRFAMSGSNVILDAGERDKEKGGREGRERKKDNCRRKVRKREVKGLSDRKRK